MVPRFRSYFYLCLSLSLGAENDPHKDLILRNFINWDNSSNHTTWIYSGVSTQRQRLSIISVFIRWDSFLSFSSQFIIMNIKNPPWYPSLTSNTYEPYFTFSLLRLIPSEQKPRFLKHNFDSITFFHCMVDKSGNIIPVSDSLHSTVRKEEGIHF